MIRRRIHRTLALALIAGPSLCASAWGQSPYANAARDLAANCANCHGTNGHGVGGMPTLAGRPQERLIEALTAFRSGARAGTVMPQLTKGYSPAQLEAIAMYLSSQPQQAARP